MLEAVAGPLAAVRNQRPLEQGHELAVVRVQRLDGDAVRLELLHAFPPRCLPRGTVSTGAKIRSGYASEALVREVEERTKEIVSFEHDLDRQRRWLDERTDGSAPQRVAGKKNSNRDPRWSGS